MQEQQQNMIVEYNVPDAAIAELREQFKEVPTIEDNKGLTVAKANISVVRTLRTSVEKKRKELKRDALDFGKKVDTEAKRITALLLEVEEPMKEEKERYEAVKKAEKEDKDRIERERIEAISAKMNAITQIPVDLVGAGSSEIAKAMNTLAGGPDEFDYQEFTDRAQAIKQEAIGALSNLLTVAMQKEKEEREAAEEKVRLAKEREELDAKRKADEEAAAERERAAQAEETRLAEERQKLEDEQAALDAQKAEQEAPEEPEDEPEPTTNIKVPSEEASTEEPADTEVKSSDPVDLLQEVRSLLCDYESRCENEDLASLTYPEAVELVLNIRDTVFRSES